MTSANFAGSLAIVLFYAFTGVALGDGVSASSFVKIPFSVLFGAAVGFAIGLILALYFKRIHIRDTAKVMILLSIAFMLVTAEDRFGEIIPFSGLLAVMGMGLACGNIVLTVAVLSILITAPIGAFLIDASYKKLLEHAK